MLELNQIHLGDCLELMKEIPDKSVDLVLTDPPFFIPSTHYQSRADWGYKTYSDLSPLKAFWIYMNQLIERVLKDTGHMVVFCNCDSYPVFYEAMYGKYFRLKSLVWDKTRVGLGHVFRHQHELMIWARYETSKFNTNGKLVSDIISIPATNSADRDHPVEKPPGLLKRILEPITEQGDTVLDCFSGSGTTAIACLELNRNFICIEKDPKYWELSVNRVNDYKAQLKMEFA